MGIPAILLVRLLIPPLILLMWPSAPTCKWALGNGSWLLIVPWMASVDAGQVFGGSRFFSRHQKKIVPALMLVPILASFIFWKPIAAEYYFWRGFWPQEASQEDAPFRKAHMLRPTSERNACNYAAEISLSALRMRQDHEAALECALEAVSIFPKRAWSYTVVSTIYDRMGRPDEALEYSRKALAVARATTPDDYRRRLDGGLPPSE
jgi:hypothetical protein